MDLPLLKELCEARGKLLDAKNKAKTEAMNKVEKDSDKTLNKKTNKKSQYL